MKRYFEPIGIFGIPDEITDEQFLEALVEACEDRGWEYCGTVMQRWSNCGTVTRNPSAREQDGEA